MQRRQKFAWITVLVVAVAASLAGAAPAGSGEAPTPAAHSPAPTVANTPDPWPPAIRAVGLCIAGAITAIGGAVAISHIGGKCLESIARQPEAAGQMFGPMIISAAMVEGAVLFAILICLIIGLQ